MSGGILPLIDETLQLLELRHPDAKDKSQQALLQDQYKKCIQMCQYVKCTCISPYSGRMRENARKMRARITPNTDSFYTVCMTTFKKN